MTEPIAAKPPPQPLKPSPLHKLQGQHIKFVAALEKYGSESSGEEWDKMAQYLHWHLDEVKLYSYWYMHQLHYTASACAFACDEKVVGKTETKTSLFGSKSAKDDNHLSRDDETEDDVREWTYQECILFDTLLATYDPHNIGQGDGQIFTEKCKYIKASSMRWHKMSAMIPNKTATQCCTRYQELYNRCPR